MTNIINNLLRGQYTPHEPSKFFIDRMAEINRELNAVEGVNIANPYYQAVPYIREIIQANRRLKLLVDEMNLPEQNVPTPAGPVQEKAEDFFNLSVGGGGGGITPDPNIVAASAFNRGTGTDQVSPVTGLTYVEDSLLKPWEKAYRIKQNQKRT